MAFFVTPRTLIGLSLLALVSALRSVTVADCQVVIAGGSASASAAALSSAAIGIKTCLLEPTDWPGGQLTASAVPAIDFAWHTVTDHNRTENVAAIDRAKENITPNFYSMLQKVGSTGACWVSDYCFLPESLLTTALLPLLSAASPFLSVYYNTVVKNVTMSPNGTQILSLLAIQRAPTSSTPCGGYDQLLSQDLPDWYSPSDSSRFSKTLLSFSSSVPPIFLDATEWGELLVLSGAPYLQAMSEQYDGDISGIGNDTCGQASTLGFTQVLSATPVNESADPYPVPPSFTSYYSLDGYPWQEVWTYRRLTAAAKGGGPTPGDVTLQNWDNGDDNSFSYLLLSRTAAAAQTSDWQGGVNLSSLQTAEYLSYGYHYWFKQQANIANFSFMSKSVLGTCHGLAKVPYMRDTRRSIGLNGFVMNVTQISGEVAQVVGEIFPDRVALGAYDVDIHPIRNCSYPAYVSSTYYPILPFFIPFRAMTNQKITNLLVSGKTMAQSFLVNAATRLHPIEWSSGTAAGVAAAMMVKLGLSNTSQVLPHMSQLQSLVALFTPISWNVNGTLYPTPPL